MSTNTDTEIDRARTPPELTTAINDAVRDTLRLRRRRKVRYFRLAGTAPLPEYFEFAEPEV